MPTNQILTIEKAADGQLWGRVEYEDNLLVDSAKNQEGLEKKFKKLLHDFHNVDPNKIKFQIAYDLTSVFQQHEYLNVSAVAERAGINPSLMRQYSSGKKYPSPDKAKHIEQALHCLGKELLQVRVTTPQKKRSAKIA